MRILLISYCFYPHAFPETYVLAKTFGYSKQFEIDVLSIDPISTFPKDYSLKEYVDNGFNSITRVPSHFLSRHINGSLLRIPDPFIFTGPEITKKAVELISNNKYDAVITSSFWHSAHLVGLKLRNLFPNLPWVVRLSDPWASNPLQPYRLLNHSINRRLERRVFSLADQIVFTSPETLEYVAKEYPSEICEKFVTVPHCFDARLFPKKESESGNTKHPYIIRSTGHFYGKRSPEPLFRAIEDISRSKPKLLDGLSIEIYGSMGKHENLISKYPSAQKIIHTYPTVGYLESLALVTEASCLLLVDAPSEKSIFLPSKLVDYLGTRRPVFGITPHGTSERVILKFSGTVADPSEPETVREKLMEILVKRPSQSNIDTSEFSQSAIQFSYREIFKRAITENKNTFNNLNRFFPK